MFFVDGKGDAIGFIEGGIHRFNVPALRVETKNVLGVEFLDLVGARLEKVVGIAEPKGAVGVERQVVGSVERFALVAVGDRGVAAVGIVANDAAGGLLGDEKGSGVMGVGREGAGFVAGVLEFDDAFGLRPPVDDVGVYRAVHEVAALLVVDPEGAFAAVVVAAGDFLQYQVLTYRKFMLKLSDALNRLSACRGEGDREKEG